METSSQLIEPPNEQAVSDWIAKPLREKLYWDQTTTDVSVTLSLPVTNPALKLPKGSVKVSFKVDEVVVELPFLGAYLKEKLHRRIKPSESMWVVADDEVQLTLVKDGDRVWKALFDRPDENSLEKSHRDVLQGLVNADEPSQSYDEMDEEARMLLEQLRDRQAMLSQGVIDLENGFDDFRLSIGNNLY